MATNAQKYRQMLAAGDFIVSPGVYDGYSARLVEAAGFSTAATSGAAVSNSLLGIADIGVMGLSENVSHCRNIARSRKNILSCNSSKRRNSPPRSRSNRFADSVSMPRFYSATFS